MKKLLLEEHISAFVMGAMVLLAFINIISRIFSGFSFWFCSNFSKFLQFSLLSGSPSEVYFKQLTGIPSTGSFPEY